MNFTNAYRIFELDAKVIILTIALDDDGYVALWIQNQFNADSFEVKRFDRKNIDGFFSYMKACGISYNCIQAEYNSWIKYAFASNTYAKDLKFLAKENFINDIYTIKFDNGQQIVADATIKVKKS